jgi:hypothetical protein
LSLPEVERGFENERRTYPMKPEERERQRERRESVKGNSE